MTRTVLKILPHSRPHAHIYENDFLAVAMHAHASVHLQTFLLLVLRDSYLPYRLICSNGFFLIAVFFVVFTKQQQQKW